MKPLPVIAVLATALLAGTAARKAATTPYDAAVRILPRQPVAFEVDAPDSAVAAWLGPLQAMPGRSPFRARFSRNTRDSLYFERAAGAGSVPLAAIGRLWVAKPSLGTGTLVGAAFGALGLGLAAGSDFPLAALAGGTAGGLVGSLVGLEFPHWSLAYRDPARPGRRAPLTGLPLGTPAERPLSVTALGGDAVDESAPCAAARLSLALGPTAFLGAELARYWYPRRTESLEYGVRQTRRRDTALSLVGGARIGRFAVRPTVVGGVGIVQDRAVNRYVWDPTDQEYADTKYELAFLAAPGVEIGRGALRLHVEGRWQEFVLEHERNVIAITAGVSVR